MYGEVWSAEDLQLFLKGLLRNSIAPFYLHPGALLYLRYDLPPWNLFAPAQLSQA